MELAEIVETIHEPRTMKHHLLNDHNHLAILHLHIFVSVTVYILLPSKYSNVLAGNSLFNLPVSISVSTVPEPQLGFWQTAVMY